jgi:hypothetical protein
VTLKDWERDIINRQRNIVFPDTVLNEGRFYRNLTIAGQQSLIVKIGSILLALFFIGAGSVTLALAIGEYLSSRHEFVTIVMLGVGILSGGGMILFGIGFWLRTLFREPARRRKRRRGYRRSSIE